MTILTWLGAALTLALLVYLVVVMLQPELFS